MRGHAHEGLQASVGQCELIDKVSAFTQWANLGSHPASCKLCGPTRQSRVAANCVLYGPMRAKCPNITVHEMGPCGGMRRRPPGLCGQTRAHRQCTHGGPMRANCPNIMVHEMGPCEGMRTRASRPLWANPSSSARPVHSHRGPTSAAILLAVNYAGPHDCLVRQPIVCLMGQCELIAQILWCMKRAHARACAQGPPGLCGPTRAHRQGQCIHIMGQPRRPSR